MKTHTSPMKLHRSWFRPRTPRTVDKKGVAVALAFLVAIAALAGGRGEKSIDKQSGEERPVVSTRIDYRPAESGDHLARTDRGALAPHRQEPEDRVQHPPTVLSR